MFDYAVRDNAFAKLWEAPDYINELDYVAEFNDKNFGEFLLEHFGEIYQPKSPTNISKNKGFIHYREAGEISDQVTHKLFSRPEYKKILTYL